MAGNRNANLLTAMFAGALLLLAGFAPSVVPAASAQLPEPGAQTDAPNPLTDSTVKPGKALLFDLEARFAKDVAARGGAAFADWFAGDGVSLGNGAAPNIGKVAIAKSATWSPKDYQLTWTPTDATHGPIRRHGLHLGTLRRPQQGRQRLPGFNQRAIHHHVAPRTRRQLEGRPRRRRKRSAISRRLLQAARWKLSIDSLQTGLGPSH